MAVEPYDWQRDQGLDFPDDPSEEPTLEEIKGYAARYEQQPEPRGDGSLHA